MSTTDFLLQKHVLAAAAWVLVVAIAGGLATEVGAWYKALIQPPWKPPDWAFGVVWTCIFIASAFAWLEFWSRGPSANQKSIVIVLFLLNGAFNILWSVLYFNLHRPDRSILFMGIGRCHYCGDDSGIEPSGVVDGAVLGVGLDCDGPQLGNDSPQWTVCLSGYHHETTQPRRKPPHRTD